MYWSRQKIKEQNLGHLPNIYSGISCVVWPGLPISGEKTILLNIQYLLCPKYRFKIIFNSNFHEKFNSFKYSTSIWPKNRFNILSNNHFQRKIDSLKYSISKKNLYRRRLLTSHPIRWTGQTASGTPGHQYYSFNCNQTSRPPKNIRQLSSWYLLSNTYLL